MCILVKVWFSKAITLNCESTLFQPNTKPLALYTLGILTRKWKNDTIDPSTIANNKVKLLYKHTVPAFNSYTK